MYPGTTIEKVLDMLLRSVSAVDECYLPANHIFGRTLSRDIHALLSVPSFDRSSVDGYAIDSALTTDVNGGNPVILKISGTLKAGSLYGKVESGSVVKIMTGAPIPDGCDAVLSYEEVKESKGCILINRSISPGLNIVPEGADIKKGETLARRGTIISPPIAGVLASSGIGSIPVYRRVRTGIISTGDEVIDPWDQAAPGKTYNTSSFAIAARCSETGVDPVYYGVVPDRADIISEKIINALKETDIVITTGGISRGDFDLVEKAVLSSGAEILFSGLFHSRGSAMIGAEKNGKLIISLSGNPLSALANFDFFIKPVLKKMSGLNRYLPSYINAVMAEEYIRNDSRRKLVHGRLFMGNGVCYVEPFRHSRSRSVAFIPESNFLIDIPEGCVSIQAGQRVRGFITGDIGEVYREDPGSIPLFADFQQKDYQAV